MAWILVVGLPANALAYDINVTEKGARIRWSEDALAFRVNPEFRAMLGGERSDAALGMALDAWRGFPGVPDMLVKDGEPARPGYRGGRPSNGVYLLREWDYEPDKLAITVVTYEMDTGRLLDADILVNPHVRFDLLAEDEALSAEAYDLGAVLTHEAGHALGLGESMDAPDATMWPFARMGDTHQRTLSEDDEAGIIEAYAGPAPLPAMGCGQNAVAGRRAAGAGAWLLLALLGGCAVRLRRRGGAAGRRAAALALVAWVATAGGPPAVADDDLGAARSLTLARPIDAAHPGAAQRMAKLLRSGDRTRVGAVRRVEVQRRDGLLYSTFEVDGERFELPGGELDGIGQVVGHTLPPRDGDEIVLVKRVQGAARWAFHARGLVWGGALGEGPALPLPSSR
ncbi:MAG: matrixin family metalloprotease [Myxococcales bacterium]